MKKAKIPQKRIIAMLMPVFYFKTHNVNQRNALDKSTGHLNFTCYCMRLATPDMELTLVEQKLNQNLRSIPDESHTNKYLFSYDKELMM
jgi:hypothetical protein